MATELSLETIWNFFGHYGNLQRLSGMEPLKGKEATVTRATNGLDGCCAFKVKKCPFTFKCEMLDQNHHGNPEIHITTDGTTVHAVMKQGGKVVKRSKAVCGADDKFDFLTGTKIALGRLEEKRKPKFVPYLLCKGLLGAEENYGTIGEVVSMTLPFGEPLYVGDVVECYDTDTEYCSKGFVVKPIGKESFVMGLKGKPFKNGVSTEWQIRKAKSYKDLRHGETYDNVAVVLQKE